MSQQDMNVNIKEILSVTFGILSTEQILKMSVCEINIPKLGGVDKTEDLFGTVYDPRMGTAVNGKNCETCGQNVWDCPGHFGHIKLSEPIVHPLYFKNVINFLSCFCVKCHMLLVSEDHLRLNNITRRFDKILSKLENIYICSHCSSPQPEFRYSTVDTNVYMKYKEKEKISVVMSVDDIFTIFDDISETDVRLLGLNPGLVHPRNFIMSHFVVLPQCFVENTIVLTRNGYKFIQNVRSSDLLYTHKGRFRKINEVFITNYTNNRLVNIEVAYHFNTIKCTPEHPFFIKDRNGFIWLEAEDLCVDKYIGMKRNKNNFIPMFSFVIDGEDIVKKMDNLDEWFFMGYFLKNGWVDCSEEGTFYLYTEEHSKVKVLDLLNTLNINGHMMQFENCIIKCRDLLLWDILSDFKRKESEIPFWVHDAPVEALEHFIQGYKFLDQIHDQNIEFLLSLQMLYMKLGVVMNKEQQIIDTEDNDFVFIDDEYVWFKILSVNEKQVLGTIKVYNFEVDEDNSYVVENLIGHNCCRPYVVTDGNMCDDDLTLHLIEIIKANNHLSKENNVQLTETQRQKYLQTLKFKISTFYNNSGGRARHTTNGRPIKGIKERLTGGEESRVFF